MDFTGGLADAVSKLPAEFQKDFAPFLDQASALESKTALDVNQIVDKVIAGVMPRIDKTCAAVDTLTLTIGASVQELMTTVQRIDGATVTVKLGPEPGT